MKKAFVIVLCLMIVSWCVAVEKIDLRSANQVMKQMRQVRSLQDVPGHQILHGVLGLNQDVTFQLLKETNTRNLVHARYIMKYKGIPVWGEHVVITQDQEKRLVYMHGTAVVGIENDVTNVKAAFDEKEALDSMKAIHAKNKTARIYENEQSELVIYVHQDKAVLAYAVSFFSDVEGGGEPTQPQYIIDATTKEVLLQYENLMTEEGKGPGGNAKTGKYEYGVDYKPFLVTVGTDGKYKMETPNVTTINLNHSSYGSAIHTFDGPTNTVKEINGAYSPLNDAHAFGLVIFSMYNDWYGTKPINQKLTLKIHYSKNYENAFWNGSSMTFGDGASRFYPLVSLDVVSHELGHGVTQQNSGLNYSGQSGGVNESFSDMAGEAAEYYMHGKNDWMVGAQIFKKDGALRYLDDPTKDGKSIGHVKDYTSSMDVHYSSGVYNKVFYLLANSSNWNTKKAFDVFMKANQAYWTPSSDFTKCGIGARDAAKSLGYDTDAVYKALEGVGVQISTVEE